MLTSDSQFWGMLSLSPVCTHIHISTCTYTTHSHTHSNTNYPPHWSLKHPDPKTICTHIHISTCTCTTHSHTHSNTNYPPHWSPNTLTQKPVHIQTPPPTHSTLSHSDPTLNSCPNSCAQYQHHLHPPSQWLTHAQHDHPDPTSLLSKHGA